MGASDEAQEDALCLRRLWFGLAFIALASPARAAVPSLVPESGEPQGPLSLSRAALHADAVVEAKALLEGSFQVLRSHLGNLAPGRRLPFSQCRSIEPRYDPEETLQRIAHLPAGAHPPAVSARFVLLVYVNKDATWGFRQRAAGDLFLLDGGKAYQLTEDQDDPKKPQLWAPYRFAPEESGFLRELASELGRRRRFDSALGLQDPRARAAALRDFLEPKIRSDPFVLDAIRALGGLGTRGLSVLLEAADRPELAAFVPVLMRAFGEKKYSGAAPWLKSRCRAALGSLNANELPFDPAGPAAVLEDARAYQELQSCLRALAAIGGPDGAPEARDAAAWFLAHKADWWPTAFQSAAEAAPFLEMVRGAGSAGPALASQAEALIQAGPSPEAGVYGNFARAFFKRYSRDAVPFLLWAWKKADPRTSNLAHRELLQAAGRDLGDDPLVWWRWYLGLVTK